MSILLTYFSFQYREERIKKEVEKFRKERPKIQQQFTDLKRELVGFLMKQQISFLKKQLLVSLI